MSLRSKRKVARVKDAVGIAQILAHYGYQVHPDPQGREQQFSCDLHGDGADKRKSARAYDNSTYCFACQKARDVIDYVMIKEGLKFGEAVRWLEDFANLEPLPWSDEDRKEDLDKPDTPQPVSIQAPFEPTVDFDRLVKRVDAYLLMLTQERVDDTPLRGLMRCWEILDRIKYQHRNEMLTSEQAAKQLATLFMKVSQK